MSRSTHQRERLITLYRLLQEHSYNDSGITMAFILEEMKRRNIPAERRSIKRDMDALNKCGVEIEKKRIRPPAYALRNRLFSKEDLRLLLDAIDTSKYLPQEDTNALKKKLLNMNSTGKEVTTDRRISNLDRVRMRNQSVSRNIMNIELAINCAKKIAWTHTRYGLDKQLEETRAEKHVETPIHLVYESGLYYMIAFSDDSKTPKQYRVDRMTGVRVTDLFSRRDKIVGSFDLRHYEKVQFGMFCGKEVKATLIVELPGMNAVIDRFGEEVKSELLKDTEGQKARVTVNIIDCKPFYGWLAGMGGLITIERPSYLRDNFRNHLTEVLNLYPPKHGSIL